MTDINKKKISVVIPYFKGEQYIVQAVESVVKQPYKNIELLLINDGSPDNGNDICEKLAAEYSCIKYFKKENEGIGATRNFGILHSTGEYIAFLDQDDIWIKDFLDDETVDKIFNGGDVVCFSLYSCNEDFSRGAIIVVEPRILINGGVKAAQTCWNHHSSMFFKRDTLIKHTILCPPTRHEDEIFRHKCLYVSEQVTLINKPMFMHRNNPASETHRKYSAENLFGPLLRSWKDFLNWCQNSYPDDKELSIFAKTLFCSYILEGLEILYSSNRKKSELKCIVKEHFCYDELIEYKDDIRYIPLTDRINEYLNHPIRFAFKSNFKKYRYTIIKTLMKIPFVKSYIYSKEYPVVLSKDLLY